VTPRRVDTCGVVGSRLVPVRARKIGRPVGGRNCIGARMTGRTPPRARRGPRTGHPRRRRTYNPVGRDP
jgi:hypothetical protein